MANTQKSAAQASITISSLSKRYRGSDKIALNKLSLSVYPGEVYGFLGPNGAGKSTTIRMLMNFIQPTDGQATILGYDVVTDSVQIKKSVGYLSGDLAMYPKMTGEQYLSYMHDIRPAESSAYIKELAKKFNADLNKKLGELSRGNRQKIGIIQAFMHKPEVLILDEPSSGLDPLMQEEFYDLLREAKDRDATIFMSSHIMSEVQKVCDRVGIIREGKLINERSISDMATEAAQTFDIVFANKAPVPALKKVSGLKVVSHDGNNVTIHVHGKLSPLFTVLAKYDVLKMDARNLDLEELFLRYYHNEEDKK